MKNNEKNNFEDMPDDNVDLLILHGLRKQCIFRDILFFVIGFAIICIQAYNFFDFSNN